MKTIEVKQETRIYNVPVMVRVRVGQNAYKKLESFKLRFYRALGLNV